MVWLAVLPFSYCLTDTDETYWDVLIIVTFSHLSCAFIVMLGESVGLTNKNKRFDPYLWQGRSRSQVDIILSGELSHYWTWCTHRQVRLTVSDLSGCLNEAHVIILCLQILTGVHLPGQHVHRHFVSLRGFDRQSFLDRQTDRWGWYMEVVREHHDQKLFAPLMEWLITFGKEHC